MNYVSGSTNVFVFDTDGEQNTSILDANCERMKSFGYNLILLIQVRNLEQELVRSTDIRKIEDLTNSRSEKDFKHDFIRVRNLMALLEKHSFDIDRLWITPAGSVFAKYPRNANMVKKRK